uniref:Uncharacterized protein AlNc14C1G205 n=1 Tax=Albugo laibachii Nc14 TaxID=890382 RepID=F0VZ64_9STRA|nr:conserved hypothetical protein [Albugo laibachii Nc14]|eukprot:CCA14079.1 conserved hypothetical protein [Albugo laibachii Nc14]
MRSSAKLPIVTAVLTLCAVTKRHLVSSHSWVDCLGTNRTKVYNESESYIYGGEKGNGQCEGYACDYPGRGIGSIGAEFTHRVMMNEFEKGATTCASCSPTSYSGWRHRIHVHPGEIVYYAYTENGHVTKDSKGVGTTMRVYSTLVAGEAITSTLQLTEKNVVPGSDRLFDDGNCGESTDKQGRPTGRAGDGKPCIGNFVLPDGLKPGIYFMVWVWNLYETSAKVNGYPGEIYLSCFEVELLAGGKKVGEGSDKGNDPEHHNPPTIHEKNKNNRDQHQHVPDSIPPPHLPTNIPPAPPSSPPHIITAAPTPSVPQTPSLSSYNKPLPAPVPAYNQQPPPPVPSYNQPPPPPPLIGSAVTPKSSTPTQVQNEAALLDFSETEGPGYVPVVANTANHCY